MWICVMIMVLIYLEHRLFWNWNQDVFCFSSGVEVKDDEEKVEVLDAKEEQSYEIIQKMIEGLLDIQIWSNF